MTAREHPAPELLSDYALGRLNEADLEGIAEHLDQCDDCQETLTSLAGEDTLVRGLAMEFETSSFASEADLAEVLEALKEKPRDETLDFTRDRIEPEEANTPQTLRDYRLLEKLGSGGMGTVYRAKHERLGRLVALKVLPRERMRQPQAIARFAREMQAVGNLDHPHIVRAFDAGETDGKHFLAMELIDGVDLSALSKQQGPLSVGIACELVRQAALGLQYAHDQGLVHRDVKPSNLMLDRTGIVKVLDLGLARLLSDTSEEVPPENPEDESFEGSNFQTLDAALTGTDQVMGTPDYMAPEQCMVGQCTGAKVDARSDVFSLGATLYKLLTACAPYSGSEFNTLAKKVTGLAERPVPPVTKHRQDLPTKLIKLIDRMLEKDPESRPQTAEEVAQSLEQFASTGKLQDLLADLHGQDASVTSNVIPSSAVSPPSGFGRRWLIGAACFGFFVAAIVLLKLQTPEGQLIVEVPPEARNQVQVEVRQGNQIKVFNPEEGWEAKLDEGNWEVKLKNGGDEFQLDKDRITIERGEKQLVRIVLDRKNANIQHTTVAEVSSDDLTADPKRSKWSLDCTLYTKAYDLDDTGVVKLNDRLSWRVMSEYRGMSSTGPTKDPRITIALVDYKKNFWPMIMKLSLKQARGFQEVVSEIAKQEDAGERKLIATMNCKQRDRDEIGRILLPEETWFSFGAAKNPEGHDLLEMKIYPSSNKRQRQSPIFTAQMSHTIARRLATRLSEVIEQKVRSVALERPQPSVRWRFTTFLDKPISKHQLIEKDIEDLGVVGTEWRFEAEEPTTFRLFEIDTTKQDNAKDLEDCVITYRAKMKTENVQGKAFLEMWVRVPPGPEAFSRGFHHAVGGSNEWATYETPFFLKKGQKADMLKLNLKVEGQGTVSIKDVEVVVAPMSEVPSEGGKR